MSAQPTYTCKTCGRVVACQMLGRSAGPEPAKRKLIKACAKDGHKADPQYRAGVAATWPMGQA